MCKPNRLTRPLRRADALAGKARAIKCYILLPRGHSNGTLSVGSASHATLSCVERVCAGRVLAIVQDMDDHRPEKQGMRQ
jgi:hypothetical protein